MSFQDSLQKLRSSKQPNIWCFVHVDQLNLKLFQNLESFGLLFVESISDFSQHPFHKQRIAHLAANYRHFALEVASQGIPVCYLQTPVPIAHALGEWATQNGPIQALEPAEFELRQSLNELAENNLLEMVPHPGWMTTPADLNAAEKNGSWRMDAFYRQVRNRTGILMEAGKPIGGKYSFDTENRQPWRGVPAEATPPEFAPNPILSEVVDWIELNFPNNPGTLNPDTIACTEDQTETLWTWALRECLPNFGPYEDAMSTHARNLFHTRVSALLNIHRLLPERVVADVAALNIPFQSKEGFIRQVLGWREFVYQVHRATNGFRKNTTQPASPSELDAHNHLPAAFWGTPSGLNCLDTVVAHVWKDAYSHHITRLMILGNIATLLSIEPREVSDWFSIAYIDSFDWVVEPNVLGMATFALGPLFTTKPYVAGANYISKMSDFCDDCQFQPGKDCPVTRLYWSFLARNFEKLASNPRLRPVMTGFRKRDESQKDQDQRIFDWVRSSLEHGSTLRLEDYPNP